MEQERGVTISSGREAVAVVATAVRIANSLRRRHRRRHRLRHRRRRRRIIIIAPE